MAAELGAEVPAEKHHQHGPLTSHNNIDSTSASEEEKSQKGGDEENLTGGGQISQPIAVGAPPQGPPGFGNPNDFPDGGLRAWLVVAGAFATNMCAFGWINCIGVFQAYYQTNYLSSYSPRDISWIASLELAIMFGCGFIVGRLYDKYGPHKLILFGTFMHVFGLMMASLSTTYYQILLSQGICSPIGICCLFTPAVSATTTWFRAKRGLAMGIISAGSSIGGVFLPIVFNRLIKQIGFPWAMRVCAFIILGLLIFANLTVKARIPPSPKPMPVSALLKPFTEKAYAATVGSAFIYFLALFVPVNYLAVQAIELGMSRDLTQYLIPILNAAG